MATADKTEAPLMTPSAVFVPACRSGLLIFGHATEGRRGRSWLGGSHRSRDGLWRAFFSLCPLGWLRLLHPLLLARGGISLPLLTSRIGLAKIMQHGITP